MVNNRNTTIFKTFHDRLNLRDGIFMDNELASNKAIPVIEIDKPICDVIANATGTDSTSTTIYTTPSDKDFYLCTAAMTLAKDGSSPSTGTSIIINIGGSNRTILSILGFATTAQTASQAITFNVPIKVDRGTTITIQNTSATSSIVCRGMITGFISDTLRY